MKKLTSLLLVTMMSVVLAGCYTKSCNNRMEEVKDTTTTTTTTKVTK